MPKVFVHIFQLRMHFSISNVRDSSSNVRNSKSNVRDSSLNVRNSKSNIRDSNSNIRDSNVHSRIPFCVRIECECSNLQTSNANHEPETRMRIANPKHELESRMPNTIDNYGRRTRVTSTGIKHDFLFMQIKLWWKPAYNLVPGACVHQKVGHLGFWKNKFWRGWIRFSSQIQADRINQPEVIIVNIVIHIYQPQMAPHKAPQLRKFKFSAGKVWLIGEAYLGRSELGFWK